jgi:hypothetical protein
MLLLTASEELFGILLRIFRKFLSLSVGVCRRAKLACARVSVRLSCDTPCFLHFELGPDRSL